MNGFLKKFFVNKTCAYIHYDELRSDKVVNQTRKFPNPQKAKDWVRTELVNRNIYNVRFIVAQKLDIEAADSVSGEVF